MLRNEEIIDALIMAATRELFESNGIAVDSVSEGIDAGEALAVIGFSGGSIRGALGIAVRMELLMLAIERGGGDATVPGASEDFLGELANQLLGRLKNKLLAYGVEISLALPMVLRGIELRLTATRAAPVRAYTFSGEAGNVSVWLDARLEPDLELRYTQDAVPSAEGDMLLF